MLRQPEQRILSAYHRHVGPGELSLPHSWPEKEPPTNINEYLEQQKGCAVKLLTRQISNSSDTTHPCMSRVSPTVEDVTRAKQQLHVEMAFVGITEEYDLSVCLFHAMFGGKCHDEEFQNLRPGAFSLTHNDFGASLYDTGELEGWHDEFDGPLYEEAKLIFQKNLDEYGVTYENCPSLCSDVGP
mmetsp:Transcript_73460/g.162502  ORF Transcript_73460/g.162502 Transcript_73460/m.162502 type:complete len:185 (-) Transcript_73460:111-665(-)